MSSDKQIGVKVSEERLKEIGELAQRKGVTVAGLIRQFVYERLDAELVDKAA